MKKNLQEEKAKMLLSVLEADRKDWRDLERRLAKDDKPFEQAEEDRLIVGHLLDILEVQSETELKEQKEIYKEVL